MDEKLLVALARNKQKQRPLKIKAKVGFKGLVSDAILEFNKGIKENYNLLLEHAGDQNIKSSEMIKIYQECVSHAHLLDKHHTTLIKTLLQVRWMERENEVVDHFRDFVVALVTSNPVHLRAVLTSLAQCFLGLQSQDADELIDTSYALETAHNIFKTIFSMIPQSFLVAETVFYTCFPFRTKSLYNLKSYMKHILLVSKYQPKLRPVILEYIFKNLVQLDVHSPRYAIEESKCEDESKEEEMFQLDEEVQKKEKLEDTEMKHDQANKLDHLLEMLYHYIRDVCYKNGQFAIEESRKLFREIIPAFDKVLLPIYQLSHVQFSVFYMCSFKASFYDTFIDHCWKITTDNNTSPIIRQTAVCYIASFLARARYVPLSTAKASLDTMSAWCHQYLKRALESELSSSSHCDPIRHGPFYSVCQAILYVIVFRHRQILESKHGHTYIQSLNLQHLILSPLNPLRICLTSVVSLFASTMRTHQIVYCDSIIERNNRQVVPVVGSITSDESQVNPLESFFPFDPYLLKRSSSFVKPLYVEWTGAVPTSTKDFEDSRDEEFLNAVEEGSLAMSVRETDMPSVSPSDFDFLT